MIDNWNVRRTDKQAPLTGVDYDWAENRLNELLIELDTLPIHNPNKPGSLFYVCLLKICSLIKGSHLIYGQVLRQITTIYAQRMGERHISYQFRRAYQRARPLQRGACL